MNWLIIGIAATNDIKTFAFVVSDVPLTAGVEVDSLLLLTFPWSGDDGSSNLVALADLVRQSKVPVGVSSDGLGS